MKKFFQYILVATLMGGTISLASCDDDEDTLNEWNMTYVSIQQADYLRPIPTFSLKHVLDEKIEQEVSVSVVASIQKVTTHDVKVNLDITCDGISADKLVKTADVALIKAGQTKSEPVTVTINDWSDLENIKEPKSLVLRIKNAGIESGASDVTASNFMQAIEYKINKSEAKPENVIFGEEPVDSEMKDNVTDWNFTFMDGVENSKSNAVAGTGGSDVATNGVPFWIVVDFKEPKVVTGIRTHHWGSYYAPSRVELYTSNDGVNWKAQGEVATKGGQQIMAFKKPVTTQYLKYQMLTVPGRVDVTRFYVYMKK